MCSFRCTFMHIGLKRYLSYFSLSCSLHGPPPSAFSANLILSSASLCQILDVSLPAAHISLYCSSLCTVIYFSQILCQRCHSLEFPLSLCKHPNPPLLLFFQDFPLLRLDDIVDEQSNIVGFSMFNTTHPFYLEFIRSLNLSWREGCDLTYPGPAVSIMDVNY